jgi:hypothetical protein
MILSLSSLVRVVRVIGEAAMNLRRHETSIHKFPGKDYRHETYDSPINMG